MILFKILDYMTSVLMGMGTVYIVYYVISDDWNTFFAMIVGMLLGQVVLVTAILIFIPFCTVFGLFPVGMVITIFVGMGAGMAITMEETDFSSILIFAVLFSFIAHLAIDLYNLKLKGEVPVDNQS